MEMDGNGVAVRCMGEAIDGCGIPRAVLAGDHAHLSEAQFSKLTRSAAIELLDKLPNEVVVPFLQRLGRERGFEVRETTLRELDDDILALLARLVTLAKLRDVRTRPLKVQLSGTPVESRRRA